MRDFSLGSFLIKVIILEINAECTNPVAKEKKIVSTIISIYVNFPYMFWVIRTFSSLLNLITWTGDIFVSSGY